MNKLQVNNLRHFIREILSEARYAANKTKSQKVKTPALKQKAVRTNAGPLAAIAAKIQATLDSSPALVSFMEMPTGLQHAEEKFRRFRVDGSDKIIPAKFGGPAVSGGNKKEIMSSNYAWFCKSRIESWKAATGIEFDAADVASLLMAYAELQGPNVAAEASLVARVLPLNADGIGKLMNDIDTDADEPKGGPLGKIAWGERRNDVASKEPDTELENRLIMALNDRITGRSDPVTADAANGWITLLASRKYSKRVVPWNRGNIYRGLNLGEAELKALLKIKGKIPNKGSKKGKFTMTPFYDPEGLEGGGASSWTPNRKTTRGFIYTIPGKYAVTLTVSPADNRNHLLDVSASGIYELDQFKGFTFKKEQEVVGFGDIVCSEVEWEKDE